MGHRGTRLKQEWMKMPDEWFEPMTFGELEVGEKFICLPWPGDNQGHGGFRSGASYIFRKTHNTITGQDNWGRARNLQKGIMKNFSNELLIIHVV